MQIANHAVGVQDPHHLAGALVQAHHVVGFALITGRRHLRLTLLVQRHSLTHLVRGGRGALGHRSFAQVVVHEGGLLGLGLLVIEERLALPLVAHGLGRASLGLEVHLLAIGDAVAVHVQDIVKVSLGLGVNGILAGLVVERVAGCIEVHRLTRRRMPDAVVGRGLKGIPVLECLLRRPAVSHDLGDALGAHAGGVPAQAFGGGAVVEDNHGLGGRGRRGGLRRRGVRSGSQPRFGDGCDPVGNVSGFDVLAELLTGEPVRTGQPFQRAEHLHLLVDGIVGVRPALLCVFQPQTLFDHGKPAVIQSVGNGP